MRATWFLVPQLSPALFFENKQSYTNGNGLKESPTLSSIDAKDSPTLSAVDAMESPMKSAKDAQAMSPVTAPMAFVEKSVSYQSSPGMQPPIGMQPPMSPSSSSPLSSSSPFGMQPPMKLESDGYGNIVKELSPSSSSPFGMQPSPSSPFGMQPGMQPSPSSPFGMQPSPFGMQPPPSSPLSPLSSNLVQDRYGPPAAAIHMDVAGPAPRFLCLKTGVDFLTSVPVKGDRQYIVASNESEALKQAEPQGFVRCVSEHDVKAAEESLRASLRAQLEAENRQNLARAAEEFERMREEHENDKNKFMAKHENYKNKFMAEHVERNREDAKDIEDFIAKRDKALAVAAELYRCTSPSGPSRSVITQGKAVAEYENQNWDCQRYVMPKVTGSEGKVLGKVLPATKVIVPEGMEGYKVFSSDEGVPLHYSKIIEPKPNVMSWFVNGKKVSKEKYEQAKKGYDNEYERSYTITPQQALPMKHTSFMETPTEQSIPVGVKQHHIQSATRTSFRGSLPSRVSEGEKSL